MMCERELQASVDCELHMNCAMASKAVVAIVHLCNVALGTLLLAVGQGATRADCSHVKGRCK